ncbi:hypothetical protein TSAR_014747 [Trichomalopsis sarcophagae]|uniref:Retrotransposon gag domain-containing protein n=1 Tax=Trichomalopsis sarcophagae TaxID=543379 RepID=A0A232EFG1_9HYME|nr:hypothetical protein TSAR_014747 [Trichomalopsis sarcophagae]
MIDMIEGICSVQGYQEFGLLNFERNLQIQQQSHKRERNLARDRRHERQQEVLCKLRAAESELNALRRENKLLHEENDALKHHESSPPFVSEAIETSIAKSLRYVSFILPRFEGTDPIKYASVWIKTLNSCASYFGWTDADTLLAAKMSIGGDAKLWLLSQRRDLNTWKKFCKAFCNKYRKTETTVANVYLALAKRKKKEDEDLEEYLSEVEMLGAAISLEERQVVQFMVCGLPGDMCAMKEELKKSNTIQELRSNLKNCKTAKLKNAENLFGHEYFVSINVPKYVKNVGINIKKYAETIIMKTQKHAENIHTKTQEYAEDIYINVRNYVENTSLDNILIILFVLLLFTINIFCIYLKKFVTNLNM